MPKQKTGSTKAGRAKRRPATVRYAGEHHRAKNKIRRIIKSSGYECAEAWAKERGLLFLLPRRKEGDQ